MGKDFSIRGNEKIGLAEERIGRAEEKIGWAEEKIGRGNDFLGLFFLPPCQEKKKNSSLFGRSWNFLKARARKRSNSCL